MKIAVLYICTGKYNRFFEGFYKSAEFFFLKGIAEKEYYVFTDDMNLSKADNVHLIYKKCEGFPLDSLFRFETFLMAEKELKEYDYVYFFNANSLFLQPVGVEILPDESGLAMGVWPGRLEHQHPMFYPYERNKRSLAYVAPFGKNYTYYMAGINGGTSEAYLQMTKTLCRNIRIDYENGIIAKVHDQSHINAYLRTHPCKKLGREFCLPEEWRTKDDNPKMIFRNKVLLDPYFNKGRKFNLWARFSKGCNILWNIIRWYMKI